MTQIVHPLDAHNRSTAERAERKLRARLEADEVLLWQMDGAKGRQFVGFILGETKPLESPFDANNAVMSARVGNQELGRYLLERILALCPALYLELLNEKKERDDASRNQN